MLVICIEIRVPPPNMSITHFSSVIFQDNHRSNQYENNNNSDQISADLSENKQGISLEKSIFKESHNTMEKSSDGKSI